MKTAINIKTKVWRSIIRDLVNENWLVFEKYMAFDAGIDFDFLILKKGQQKIMFAWDNLEEGEIKCTAANFELLERKHQFRFNYGKAKNLRWPILLSTRVITFPQRFISNPAKNFDDFFDD